MLPRISLPLQLLLIIIGVSLFGNMLSQYYISVFYTISLFFKEVLSFVLPLVVFSFVFCGILSFKKNAPLVLLSMISMIFCSNALVALFVYGVVKFGFPLMGAQISDGAVVVVNDILKPLYTISFPSLLSSTHALLVAIVLGLFFSFFRSTKIERYALRIKKFVELFLSYMVIPFLPLYVLGFLLKIKHEGTFVTLLQHYGSTFIFIVVVQISYLIWLYFVAAGFSVRRAITAIGIAIPSYLTAFSTMSSTAALPVSINSAEINTGNYGLSAVAMPIMANVHLLGDSISTPILAMVTMSLFLGYLPTFTQYIVFVGYFCSTMFAASGIPAGGLIVIIPILTSQFGFTPDMISIITTLYLLLDSFGTAANVMGDGALVIIVQKILKRFNIID